MRVRYIVLAVEAEDGEDAQYAFSLVQAAAHRLRSEGLPAAAHDLEGSSPTALGAQIAAITYYVENVQSQLA